MISKIYAPINPVMPFGSEEIQRREQLNKKINYYRTINFNSTQIMEGPSRLVD